MKKLYVVVFFMSMAMYSQSNNVISRNWTSFLQSIEVTSDKEAKFKLMGSLKVMPKDDKAWAGLWIEVETKNGELDSSDSMGERVKTNVWKEYSIEGTINKNTKRLNFGGLCLYNGDFYFDNFKLFIENDKGVFQEVNIVNGNFEKQVVNNKIENWFESSNTTIIRVKEFDISSSNDAISGKKSLLIKGSGIKIPKYEFGKIGKVNAENPQIDNMIAMLEDLKDRVESIVKDLPKEHVDHLHDEKSNRIGALVLHLAAAEVYYQKYTFGESVFDKKDPELWKVGLDLGDKGREMLKDKPISYYLELYDEVRKKTIEELRKRDDVWFKQVNAGKSISNQYAWFHVMEHQSSHLGQVLFLRKRLPPLNKEVKIKKELKK